VTLVSQGIADKTEAAIKGDTAALGILFEWYRPRLYANALKVCGNTPLAQDAVQETFLSAFTHLSSLRNSSVFYPWLRKILLNHCLLGLRKEKSFVNQRHILLRESALQASFNQFCDKNPSQPLIYESMAHLSTELRSCVLLRYFSSFDSYEEIALILDVPIGTVRSRLSAARKQLAVWYAHGEDTLDDELDRSKKWSENYHRLWGHLYEDQDIRNEFYGHLLPTLDVHFTSGKMGKGRDLIEREVSDDLIFGTQFKVHDISSCGNISVIEGINQNTSEYPDRCPSSTVFVAIRKNDKIEHLHIFNSPREKNVK
jgi:RNA polymerase sigma-70 factor (ECF subfamily)